MRTLRRTTGLMTEHLSRDNERQPRLRQLQLRGVDGRSHHAIPLALVMPASANPIQCMARSDLRPAAPVRHPSGALLQRPPRGGALGTKPLEPRRVDRFERQRGLKSLDGCRVEITRGLQRPLAIRSAR